MKLKNFNWNEEAIDTVVSDDSRYTTYKGYGRHDYHLDTRPKKKPAKKQEIKREKLTSL